MTKDREKTSEIADFSKEMRSRDRVERGREQYDAFKERFLAEKVLPFARAYDYSTFSDNDFADALSVLSESYEVGDDTLNIDLQSYETSELEALWRVVDELVMTQEISRRDGASDEEIELIHSGKYRIDAAGRLLPVAVNPCVIGGVHGDEHTLPTEMERALVSQRGSLISVDAGRAYCNWKVNTAALDHAERAFSVTAQRPDERSDMNRDSVEDMVTESIKRKVLKQIAGLESPFLLDCHNDNSLNDETDIEKVRPRAYITSSGDLAHKVALAAELGIHRVIVVPDHAAKGTMVGEVREMNERGDGMVVEIRGNDDTATSSKTALKFLQMSRVLNDGRPSAGVQLLHEFQTRFPERNPDMKAFTMEPVSEAELGVDPEAHYVVLDGTPVKIAKVSVVGGRTEQVAISDDEKQLF